MRNPRLNRHATISRETNWARGAGRSTKAFRVALALNATGHDRLAALGFTPWNNRCTKQPSFAENNVCVWQANDDTIPCGSWWSTPPLLTDGGIALPANGSQTIG